MSRNEEGGETYQVYISNESAGCVFSIQRLASSISTAMCASPGGLPKIRVKLVAVKMSRNEEGGKKYQNILVMRARGASSPAALGFQHQHGHVHHLGACGSATSSSVLVFVNAFMNLFSQSYCYSYHGNDYLG
jgi:hypothetical protein